MALFKSSNPALSEKRFTDTVLDDVFQLLSLCFMAAGKNFSSPSVYVQAATIKVTALWSTLLMTASARSY